VSEAFRHKFETKAVKIAGVSHQTTGTGGLSTVEVSAPTEAEEIAPWRRLGERPLFRERESRGATSEKKIKEEEGKTDNWCRLLGTSSLKEGAV
jgi:hypothetical protein